MQSENILFYSTSLSFYATATKQSDKQIMFENFDIEILNLSQNG